MAAEHVAAGRLIRVLAKYCEPFTGYYLYYPSARKTPARPSSKPSVIPHSGERRVSSAEHCAPSVARAELGEPLRHCLSETEVGILPSTTTTEPSGAETSSTPCPRARRAHARGRYGLRATRAFDLHPALRRLWRHDEGRLKSIQLCWRRRLGTSNDDDDEDAIIAAENERRDDLTPFASVTPSDDDELRCPSCPATMTSASDGHRPTSVDARSTSERAASRT